MSRAELLDPEPGQSLGESRSRVLAALQEAVQPLGVRDVADRVGLHPNTVRFHLDALVEVGAAERTVEDRRQRGRPRTLYTALPTSASGKRQYLLLSRILASYLAAETPQPGESARQAGLAWGRFLTDRPPPFRRLDAGQAIDQLVRSLDEIGFAPAATVVGRQQQVRLRHCPFREIAGEYREVVCSLHLGLMQGLLTETEAPVEVTKLEPFVEPNLCVAHLDTRRSVDRASRAAGRQRGHPGG